MPFDNTVEVPELSVSRQSSGLPDGGFIFCCFNNSYKITEKIFDIWMQLLAEIPYSVLWLSDRDEFAIENLLKEADKRGIVADRLIFAKRAEKFADYLARYQVADLFLDTQIYNAHCTAIDCLQSGCPLVTCSGDTFASRVAGSLLRAAELPELITHNLHEYKKLALHLALNPVVLKNIRQKLKAKRTTAPLFDSKGYAQNFESALKLMWKRYQAGQTPQAFAVK